MNVFSDHRKAFPVEKIFQTSIFFYDFYLEILFLLLFSVYLEIFWNISACLRITLLFLTLYLKPSVECLALYVHGGADRVSVWGGREDRAGEGDFHWPRHHCSMEHFPAVTTVTEGGGGSGELLLPVALQNNLYFLECRKPVFFVLQSVEILTLSNTSGKCPHLSVSISWCVRAVIIVGEVSELMHPKLFEEGVFQTSLFSLIWPSA